MGKAVKLGWWVLSEELLEGKEGVCPSRSLGGGMMALAGAILARSVPSLTDVPPWCPPGEELGGRPAG